MEQYTISINVFGSFDTPVMTFTAQNTNATTTQNVAHFIMYIKNEMIRSIIVLFFSSLCFRFLLSSGVTKVIFFVSQITFAKHVSWSIVNPEYLKHSSDTFRVVCWFFLFMNRLVSINCSTSCNFFSKYILKDCIVFISWIIWYRKIYFLKYILVCCFQ